MRSHRRNSGIESKVIIIMNFDMRWRNGALLYIKYLFVYSVSAHRVVLVIDISRLDCSKTIFDIRATRFLNNKPNINTFRIMRSLILN